MVLSQDIEYSPLCYTVGLCYLSILYIIVCICSSHTLSPSLPYLQHCVSISVDVASFSFVNGGHYVWVFQEISVCTIFI